MQKEAGQYEIPAHRLHVTYQGRRLGEGRDLGEAQVVSTIFGRARVRVVRAGDPPRWLWPAFGALAFCGVAATFWLWPGASPGERAPGGMPEVTAAPQLPAVASSPAASQPAQVEEPRRAAASAPAVVAHTDSARPAEPPVKAAAKPPAAEEAPRAQAPSEEAAAEPAKKARKKRAVTPEAAPGGTGEAVAAAQAEVRAKPSFSASPAVDKPARAAANPDETAVHAARAQERGAAAPAPVTPADEVRPGQGPAQQP